MELEARFISFCVGALVGGLITNYIVTTGFESNVIKRGYAQYCPSTGDFSWKGECE